MAARQRDAAAKPLASSGFATWKSSPPHGLSETSSPWVIRTRRASVRVRAETDFRRAAPADADRVSRSPSGERANESLAKHWTRFQEPPKGDSYGRSRACAGSIRYGSSV